ncbi:hypothetical protein ACQKRQ_34220 [Paraburkholderia sp. NPDC080076]|uniref:hypothetical protein n=1 Tax=Paraburkholderia sp. NPDC080076 TaxID=3390605 RepID=UPI003D02D943
MPLHTDEILLSQLRRRILMRRVLNLAAVFTGVLSILFFSSEGFSYFILRSLPVYVSRGTASFILGLISITLFSVFYLQSGGSKKATSEAEVEALKATLYETANKEIVLNALIDRLDTFEDRVMQLEQERGFDAEEKAALAKTIVETTGKATVEEIFAQSVTALRESLRDSLSIERLSDSSITIRKRLSREISDLRLRSNINLAIGMAITISGLYLLWTTVSIIDASALLKNLASEGAETNAKFVKNLVLPMFPRVLLVVFIEVFAYFFLRLYKAGLEEIKYFQNELTNVEAKLVSVEFAHITGSTESLKSALETLSHTERNFVLEKGQTTVELEKAKSESELTRNIIKTIPSLFKRKEK